MTAPEINITASEKLELYKIARELFNNGMSYPQIVELFKTKSYNQDITEQIVEAAFHEKWDKLFDLTKSYYGQGKTYAEVTDLLKSYEKDEEMVKHVADAWYDVKTIEMESTVESPTNVLEGIKWVIISAIVVSIMFISKTSLLSKILWIIVFVGALIQYLWGLKQRSLAKYIKKYMENEQDK